jgi:hypothetical protein
LIRMGSNDALTSSADAVAQGVRQKLLPSMCAPAISDATDRPYSPVASESTSSRRCYIGQHRR